MLYKGWYPGKRHNELLSQVDTTLATLNLSSVAMIEAINNLATKVEGLSKPFDETNQKVQEAGEAFALEADALVECSQNQAKIVLALADTNKLLEETASTFKDDRLLTRSNLFQSAMLSGLMARAGVIGAPSSQPELFKYAIQWAKALEHAVQDERS